MLMYAVLLCDQIEPKSLTLGEVLSHCRPVMLMYDVLLCDQIEPKSLTLGEVLDGDRMALSLYELHFGGLQTFFEILREQVVMQLHADVFLNLIQFN